MTRVCHLTSVHAAEDVRIFLKECCDLAAAGYETHLVAPAARSYSKRGVAIHGILQKKAGRWWRMVVIGWKIYVRARALKADIYHLHDPELLLYGLALKAARKQVVYDVHEDVPRDIESKAWIPEWLRRPVGVVFERFENFIAGRLSAVVAATPYIGQRFRRVNPATVTLNNYPLSGELYPGGAPSDFSAEARPYVCYAGGISPIRGIREMVSAIARTEVRMLLAGGFSSEELRHATLKIPGWKRVDYIGHISRPELARVMKRCFAGLVLFHPEANHVHSQPNKMYEYMSAGLPLIASNFPLWREFVERVGCGICVDPLDPQAIAEAITFLDRHRGRARSMGENGRLAVTRDFNWEHEQTVLIDLYRRLLAR